MEEQKPIPAVRFDTIELLVHPFYALENLARHRDTAGLKKVSHEEALEDYAILGLEKAWRKRLALTAKNPHAVMILVGLKTSGMKMEVMFPTREYFFEGKLAKNKLAKFSATYQAFLRDAKKTLGRRLIYVSDSLQFKAWYIDSLLNARGLYPAREVKVRAYGEFMDKKDKQCVEYRIEELKQLMPLLEGNPTAKTKKLKKRGETLLSLASHDELPAAETARLIKQGIKITPQIISQRMCIKDARKYARGVNAIMRKRKLARRVG